SAFSGGGNTRNGWLRRIPALLVFVAVGLGSSNAFAQRASDDEAVRLYAEARERFQAGEFERAITLLSEAYELSHEPVLLYNMARAHESIPGHEADALELYQRYLSVEPRVHRRQVDGRIDALTRVLEADRARREAEDARVELERERRAALEAAAREEALRREAESRASPFPWTVLGVGIASAAVGVGLGLAANQQEEDAQQAETGVETAAANERAERLARASSATLILGGVLSMTGLIWGIVDVRRVRRLRVGLGAGTIHARMDF
ncbi:MAG: hypothetical protein AAF411_17795, partial [Myxococcota bacterium]